jgi:hypothetical protein
MQKNWEEKGLPCVKKCADDWNRFSITAIKSVSNTVSRIFDSADLSTFVFRIAANISELSGVFFRNFHVSRVFLDQFNAFNNVVGATRIFLLPKTLLNYTHEKFWKERRIVKIASSALWAISDIASACFFVYPDLKDKKISLCKGRSISADALNSMGMTLASTCSLVDTVYQGFKNKYLQLSDYLDILSNGSDIVVSMLPLARIEARVLFASLRVISNMASLFSRLL